MPAGYHAPPWLPGGHLQTLWPFLFSRCGQPPLRRERWERADGDFTDLDWLDGPTDAPLVVLFHGLEGSSRSHYARCLMHAVAGRGWRGVVAHFRGCSGEANRLPRAYHAGDSVEIEQMLQHLSMHARGRAMYAVGVSLGGNALLKWLGESGGAAARCLQAAVAISPPVDMLAAGRCLDQGLNRFYAAHFLKTLRAKIRHKQAVFPGLLSHVRLECLRTLHDFDDQVTAPLHGFACAEDYWRRSAAKSVLGGIALPTLLLHARNDPFLPASAMARRREVSALVSLDYPDTGGHVGFPVSPMPRRPDWLAWRALQFLEEHA